MKIHRSFSILILAASVAAARGDQPRVEVGLGDSNQVELKQLVPLLPGQSVPALPGQIVQPLPGQVVGSLPGQVAPSLPGQMVHALSGQIVQSLPGQTVHSLPWQPSTSGGLVLRVKAPASTHAHSGH